MKKDFVMPILVLSLICLFMSGALAVGHNFTQPVIESAAAQRAEAARKDVIPEADGFELLEIDGLPQTITEVYGTTNGTGFIFMITTSGYGGEIKLICGIDPDGKIIKCATLAHSETKGLGSVLFEEAEEKKYIGGDKNLEGISAIAGATISSNAYKNGITDAFAAYEIVKGAY